ncbi:uncharacterized protein LOC130724308 isoform X2 [Lotus japonicus]|uniref:uncharacterized protein LOC130724308 isoform X2 n=1 Tax=Lotus japonicus TaxID=34305 RepID=UPI00258BB2CB|nr:uncharacterized protein LOC130724308 isoform X2 [Lotus japonicus]
MDRRSARDKDIEVDIESGLPLIENDSKKVNSPSTSKQGKTLFGKSSGGPSLYCNEANLSEVSVDLMNATNKAMSVQDSANHAEKIMVKEKRKKASNKKAPKPPRPPQGPSLDAADHKLIREISQLAMLKRARVERMKALKKMKTAKSSSSNSSSMLAMVFTAIFCIVIIFQGISSGKSSVSSFQGSPLSTGGAEGDLISVQYQLNPSSDPNAPGSESHNFVQKVAGSDFPEELRKDSG